MNILVLGIGYVGLSTAIALSVQNEVLICDVLPQKVEEVNCRIASFDDNDIKEYFNMQINLRADLAMNVDYCDYDYIIIAVPTNYDEDKKNLDTSIIENTIENAIQSKATIVIRSTVPIGFTEKVKRKYNAENILYCPEFLREGSALHDVLYPSRIVIGGSRAYAERFLEVFRSSLKIENPNVILATTAEAEAIKLFANTYLALRVSFFNELDNFALINNLDTRKCINGICSDVRIGNSYNNPSFGYGGSCLPKDTKSLKQAYANVPNHIISAIDDANEGRKNFIADEILKKDVSIIGIYRLTAKKGSDTIKDSSSLDICKLLCGKGKKIVVYEPLILSECIYGCENIKDLMQFKITADLIIADRIDDYIKDVEEKIFTRDVFYDN